MQQITIEGITIEVVRKKVKNLNLRVYPPDGHVRVSIPLRASEASVTQAILERLDWIRRQQARARTYQVSYRLKYQSGEQHEFFGTPYLLEVVYQTGPQGAALLDSSRIRLTVHPRSTIAQRERILINWYRARLKEAVPALLARWEARMGVKTSFWGIRKMTTRWGSCNPRAKRIWLSLELVKRPQRSLEYVIVHELAHLTERGHNARFQRRMDSYLPGWRGLRDELNGKPIPDRTED